MKMNWLVFGIAGLAILSMLKRGSAPQIATPLIKNPDQTTVTSLTYNGWTVGEKMIVDFWDYGNRRVAGAIVKFIEYGGVYQNGDSAHIIVTLDGRDKDWGWSDFMSRNPIKM